MKWFWKWRLNVYQSRRFMLTFWDEDMYYPERLIEIDKRIAGIRKKLGIRGQSPR
jgi:hypothetical protein